ncbi:MAG: LapA family protein [Spirochaetes bacterium]|nr:LapA family protein [Spirochaetota bacterium]MBU1080324.1 LapA family protein [Spirochaetota bacterium]
MKIVYLLLVIAVAILAVMFAAQNSATVAITFFSWSTSGSLSLVLILTLTLGILIGVLIMAPSVFKRWFQSSGLRRRLHRLEKEKTSLVKEAASTAEKLAADQAACAPPDEAPASGARATGAKPGSDSPSR